MGEAMNAQSLAVVIPIYQPALPPLHDYSLERSVRALLGRELFFIAPDGLDVGWYRARYPGIGYEFFEPAFFANIQGYNRLMLGRALYERFSRYEFMLVLQTDAIQLRDDLDEWTAQPFDYIGAPWPGGYEVFVNQDNFAGDKGKRVTVCLGNGGLSLRRIAKCLALQDEFPETVATARRNGSSEDVFYSIMGEVSRGFVLPNEITAAHFSLEIEPGYYYAVNGQHLPSGVHGWWKYDVDFWRPHLPDMPPLPPKRPN
jgi:hypothetical protein